MAVEFDGKRFPVSSVEDAQEKWEQFKEATGAGVSEIGNGVPVFMDGIQVARISYNGRVWDMQDKELRPALEVPVQPNRPTEPAARAQTPALETPATAQPESGAAAPRPETPVTYSPASINESEDGWSIGKGDDRTITYAKAEKLLAEKRALRDRLMAFAECVGRA